MPLKMLANDIAVIPIEDPDQIGHIIIPEEAKQRADQGVVKYKGPEVRDLSIGDHVLFTGYTGSKVSLADEGVLFIMSEDDILAVLGEPEPFLLVSHLEELIRGMENEYRLKDKFDMSSVESFALDLIGRVRSIPYAKGLEF